MKNITIIFIIFFISSICNAQTYLEYMTANGPTMGVNYSTTQELQTMINSMDNHDVIGSSGIFEYKMHYKNDWSSLGFSYNDVAMYVQDISNLETYSNSSFFNDNTEVVTNSSAPIGVDPVNMNDLWQTFIENSIPSAGFTVEMPLSGDSNVNDAAVLVLVPLALVAFVKLFINIMKKV